MSNIGWWEIAIVLVLILIIFGPKKLPELGSSLGKSIRGFKKGLRDNREEVVSTVAQVREAAAIDEIKSTMAEVREAAGVNELKSTVAEIRRATNVKSAVSSKPEAAAGVAGAAAMAESAGTAEPTATTSTVEIEAPSESPSTPKQADAD